MNSVHPISVVIPTYNRGAALVQTLNSLFSQSEAATEIIVVDQTNYADGDQVAEQLAQLAAKDAIKWLRLDYPSIPAAMNSGLLAARSEHVLFLDDDVHFEADFIYQHSEAIGEYLAIAHVGQIIQPWQKKVELKNYRPGEGLTRDLHFPFNCDTSTEVSNCMAGNLCVQRAAAISVGGFDENFHGAAYRFESEFCRRLIRHSGRKFHFVPYASLNHLHLSTGGTRTLADHLTSVSGRHSMGDYYFALLEARGFARWKYIFKRFFGSVFCREYLRAPWYIPVRVVAEIRGFVSAVRAFIRGPKILGASGQPAMHQEPL